MIEVSYLQSKRNPITPLRLVINQRIENQRTQELPNNPTQVNVRSQITPNSQRRNLRCIRRARGRKNTPRNITKHLTDQHNLNIRREEDDENEGRKPEERSDEHLAVTPARSRPAVHQSADDIRHGGQAVEALLPGAGDLVAALFVQPLAVLVAEHGIAVEAAEQRHVVPFHDDRHRDDCFGRRPSNQHTSPSHQL